MPVVAPIVNAVAAPNALTVVAVALNTSSDVLLVVTLVVNCGLVPNTSAPDPVSFVTAAARFADVGVARNVATPVPRPLTPVPIGKPVQFVRVPDVGVPSNGVTSVGLVANTSDPEPVSSVTVALRFADVGVARNVAIPVPRPLTPVPIGSPVQFVRVPDVGVPSNGVTSVGLVANTSAPVPVSSLITPASSALVVAAKALNLLLT